MTKDAVNEITGERAKEVRAAAGMDQGPFWASLGVVQSSGSSYESGRYPIPRPVQLLMHSMYVDKKAGDAAKVRRAAAKAVKLLGEAIK